MNINAGAMITDAMQSQKQRDFIHIVISEFTATGIRIQSKLDAKAAQDPTWADIAEYHKESMRQVLGGEE
jgi:hypothetical protein